MCISCTLNPIMQKARANLRKKGRKTAHGLHDKHSNDSTQTHLATYHVLFGAFVGPGAGVMSLLLLLFVSEKNKLCSGIFRSPIVPEDVWCHKAHTNATPIGTFVGSCYTGARRQTSLSEVIAEFLFLSGRCLVGSCCNEQVTPHLGMLPQFGSFYSSLAPHLGWAQQLLPFSCQKNVFATFHSQFSRSTTN